MKPFPVVEIFGPTIQGEGPLIGVPTMFVRFGGCDYRCKWCDTPYAVLPEEVKKNSTRMTAEQIVEKVNQSQHCEWVTFSGGNPLLYDLSELVDRLHEDGWRIAVETQGTVYREWVQKADLLVVSPKPPSSGMTTDFIKLKQFMDHPNVALKVVVFDDTDYEYAVYVRQKFDDPSISFTLQVGNAVGEDTLSNLVEKLRWLIERAVKDKRLFNVRVLPQLHVWVWGNQRGV